MIDTRNKQLKHLLRLRKDNVHLAFIITPDLIVQYNHVHRLMRSFRGNDLCARDGGIMCSNLTAFKDEQLSGDKYIDFAASKSLADGSDYVASRIVDLLNRPIGDVDGGLTSSSARDEIASHIDTLTLLFEERYKRCQQQTDRLKNELSATRRDLEECHQGEQDRSTDLTVEHMRKQIATYDLHLHMVRNQVESLREVNEKSIEHSQRKIDELMERIKATGSTKHSDAFLRLLRTLIDTIESERERVVAALEHIQLLNDRRVAEATKARKQMPSISTVVNVRRSKRDDINLTKPTDVDGRAAEERIREEVNNRSAELDRLYKVELKKRTEDIERRYEEQLKKHAEDLRRNSDAELAAKVAAANSRNDADLKSLRRELKANKKELDRFRKWCGPDSEDVSTLNEKLKTNQVELEKLRRFYNTHGPFGTSSSNRGNMSNKERDELYLLRNQSTQDRSTIRKLNLEIKNLTEKIKSLAQKGSSVGAKEKVEMASERAENQLSISKRNEFIQMFRKLYNDLVHHILRITEDLKNWAENPKALGQKVIEKSIRDYRLDLDRLLEESDRVINFGYAPRETEDADDIVSRMRYQTSPSPKQYGVKSPPQPATSSTYTRKMRSRQRGTARINPMT